MAPTKAVIFDKDGTIVDFEQTWGPSISDALKAASADQNALEQAAAVLEFDLISQRFAPTSFFLAASGAALEPAIGALVDLPAFVKELSAAGVRHVTASPGAPEVFASLSAAGCKLALATNDAERNARAQLHKLGWTDHFRPVIGFDSGHGSKPEPGMVLAAVEQLGVTAAEAMLIGDTSHDLEAGQRAGVRTVLVTNGGEPTAQNMAMAHFVIATLAELPDLLDA